MLDVPDSVRAFEKFPLTADNPRRLDSGSSALANAFFRNAAVENETAAAIKRVGQNYRRLACGWVSQGSMLLSFDSPLGRMLIGAIESTPMAAAANCSRSVPVSGSIESSTVQSELKPRRAASRSTRRTMPRSLIESMRSLSRPPAAVANLAARSFLLLDRGRG